MTRAAPIRFGIAGTGRMAATMVAAIRAGRWGTVTAVCSADGQRAAEFAADHRIARAYDDLGSFAADPDIDLVYTANATRDHAATCLAVLAAGKPVLCEKPLALTVAEVDGLIAAADRSGAFLMEAMWTLFLPAYRRLAALTQQNDLGKPVHLAFDFGYPVAAADLPRATGAADGGVVFDRGCYGVALALSLLGSVAEARGDSSRATSLLSLHHHSGATSQITTSAEALLSNTASLACTGGLATLGPPSLAAERLWLQPMSATPIRAEAKGWRASLRQSALLRRLRGNLRRNPETWLPYGASQFDPMLAHVVARLAAGETTSDIVPPSLSRATIAILEAAAKPRPGVA